MSLVPFTMNLTKLLPMFLVGMSLGLSQAAAPVEEPYKLGELSQAQENTPKGSVLEGAVLKNSKAYPGTQRQWWIYVPAQYRDDQPANLMVFLDGHDYVNLKGNWRVPIVFDNLIHQKKMPVTLAVFVNPGHRGDLSELKSAWRSNNRGIEYNTLGPKFVNFLLEEVIAQVQQKYRLSDRPEAWAIGGASSGAIAAFTAAWERPDKFSKVFSTIGSYVDLNGGHAYPYLVRKADKKPIRVFLQDGSADLDNPFGNWPLANQMMHRSLLFKGYDVKFEYGVGGHNSKHGGSIFPEAMEWLWRP